MSLDIMPAAPPGNGTVATGPPGSGASIAAGSGPPVAGKNDLFALVLASQTEAVVPLATKTANAETPTADVPTSSKDNHASSKEDTASDTDQKVSQEPNLTLSEMIAAGMQALPAPNTTAQALPTTTPTVVLKSGSNSSANGQGSITKTTALEGAAVSPKTLDAMDTRSIAISPASILQSGGTDSGSLSEDAQASAETLPLLPSAGVTPTSTDTPPTSTDTPSGSTGAVTSASVASALPSPVPTAPTPPATAQLGSAPVKSGDSSSSPAKLAISAPASPSEAQPPDPANALVTSSLVSENAAAPIAAAVPVTDTPPASSQKPELPAQPMSMAAAPSTAAATNTLTVQPSATALPTVLSVTQTPQLSAITAQSTLQNMAVPANNTSKQTASAEVAATNSKMAVAAKTTTSRTSSGKPVVNAASPAATTKSGVATAPSGAADESGGASSGSPNAKSQHKAAALPAVGASAADAQSASADTSAPASTVSTSGVDSQSATTVTATAPLTGAERAQVIRQAADAVTQLHPLVKSSGTSQMTLNLHPQEWGKLQVSVQMTTARAADGTTSTGVIAHIVASDPAVKSALEAHTTDLHQALAEAGLKLDRISVTVQGADAAAKSGLSGGGQGFGQSLEQHDAQSRQTPDAQQTALSNNSAGTTTFGGSSSFSGYFEGRGERTGQGQAQSRSAGSGEGSDLELAPAISTRSIAAVRGSFDGRA